MPKALAPLAGQALAAPLARATTPSKGMLEAPNRLIINDRPLCVHLQTALSKLAVGVLQRHFDALLQMDTQRLNTTY